MIRFRSVHCVSHCRPLNWAVSPASPACGPSRGGWPPRLCRCVPSLRRAMPLLTSQKSISRMRRPDSSEPSITMPKPPFTTSPQPTPPPLWIETHCRAAESVADDVLHGHVGREARSVVDVRRLAVGRIGSRNIVVVAPQHHGGRNAAVGDGAVESLRDPRAALAVGIEDPGLRTDDQPVASGLADPVEVVFEPVRGCRPAPCAASPPALRPRDGPSCQDPPRGPKCRPSGRVRSRSRRTWAP